MAHPNVVYRFGSFELQPRERRLLCSGLVTPLPGKALDVLVCLVERAPHLVRKEELFETVWPDALVEDSNLNYTIAIVRKALRDDRQGERFIETVPRQGYRFVAPVERDEGGLARSRAPEPPPVPLVQRDAELDALTATLALAQRGVRQTVFIEGEAGIGKTSLIDCFMAERSQREAVWVARGHCIAQRGEAEPYMPVLEAFGRLCRGAGPAMVDILDRFAPSWLVQMSGVVGRDQLALLQQRLVGQTRERMLREMDEALVAATTDRTLIVVLEDLHWSDTPTIELLARVARGRDPARLLLIGTYRPADALSGAHPVHAMAQDLQLRDACTRMPLALLSAASVAHYVDRRFGGVVPSEVAGLLHRRTEGSPLFVTALIESWRARGVLEDADGAWLWRSERAGTALEPPESLRGFLEDQIQQLPRDQRQVLEAAAVAGVSFTSALVAAALDLPVDDVEATCGTLARVGRFIRAGGQREYADGTICERYEFVHGLYVEVLYGALPAGRRVRLHQQIALALEAHGGQAAPEVAAELAQHFRAARDARNTVRYLQIAAAQSLARSAPREALVQLRDALGMLSRIPENDERHGYELPLQAMMAGALTATQGFADASAEAAYRRAYELATAMRSPQVFPVAFGLATTLELQGRYRESEAIMAEQLPAQEATGGFELECRDLLACSTFHQGAFAEALEHARRGLTAFRADQHSSLTGCFGENPGVGCALWAALAHWFLGCPDQALEYAQRAVALAEAPGHAYSLANARVGLACIHQLRREAPQTEMWASRAMELGEKQGFAHRVAVARVLRGWAWGIEGERTAGLAELQQGLEAIRHIGLELDRPYFLALLAQILGADGQFDRALTALDEADQLVSASRSFFYEAELRRLRGDVLLSADGARSESAAAACFDDAMRLASRRGARSLLLRAAVARAALRCDHDEIVTMLKPLYDSFTEGLDTPDLREAASLIASIDPSTSHSSHVPA